MRACNILPQPPKNWIGLRKIVACSHSSSQCLLVSTVFGTVSSLYILLVCVLYRRFHCIHMYTTCTLAVMVTNVPQTEVMYKKNPKLLNQFQYSEREGVPLIVIVGEEEKSRGGVKIRDTNTRQEVRGHFTVL